MIVKVCGMREPNNIRAVEQSGADWMDSSFITVPHAMLSNRLLTCQNRAAGLGCLLTHRCLSFRPM